MLIKYIESNVPFRLLQELLVCVHPFSCSALGAQFKRSPRWNLVGVGIFKLYYNTCYLCLVSLLLDINMLYLV